VTVDVVAVVGATGTGKSELGVGLAQALDGEVINADSMRLYRGMDIGTAKLNRLSGEASLITWSISGMSSGQRRWRIMKSWRARPSPR
jgi:hypothetical protein